MQALAADLRYAVRMLRRAPGSTLIAIVTLALGIAGTTTLFSFVYGVLLRPLPYPEADRLVQLWQYDPARPNVHLRATPANIADWRAQTSVFAEIGYSTAWSGANTWGVIGPHGNERVAATFVSASLFRAYGVRPLLGRTFVDDEDEPGHAATVVISHRFWQSHFGGDPHILDRTVTFDSYWKRTYTIIGVMPPGFGAPAQDDLWMPMGYSEIRVPNIVNSPSRCCGWFHVVARMKPGVALSSARADMDLVSRRIALAYPEVDLGKAVKLVPLQEEQTGNLRLALLLLFGAVGCVLLIACVNVANLQLSRAVARQREVGIRTALGARIPDIVRQMLVESVTLSATGGALGLLLAVWAVRVARALTADRLPDANAVAIDPFVLAFSVGVSLLTGVLFGLAPAWQAARVRPQEALKQSSSTASAGRAQGRLRALLVIGEIAAALVLLAGASVLVRSLLRLQQVDPGFRREGLLIVSVDMTSTAFDRDDSAPAGHSRPVQFFDAWKRRVAGHAGVVSVSGVNTAPIANLAEVSFPTGVTAEGQPFRSSTQTPRADRTAIMPDYFRTMGIPLLKGREFTADDREDHPQVAIITSAMARQLWPQEDALGKRFSTLTREDLARFRERNGAHVATPWVEVVGIVADVRYAGLASAPRPLMYLPYLQFPWHAAQLIVRTSGDPIALASLVREDARALAPHAIITRVQTMDEAIEASTAAPRLGTWVAMLFATVGALLAALGLYGVMAHGVVSRTREIGIRMALGATRGRVLGLMLRQGLLMTVAGVAVGSVGVAIASQALGRVDSLLYETSAADPAALAGALVLIVVVTLAAAYLPARRATRVDPLVALRDE
jgi:putative ABC transport system permease protein